LIVTEQAVPNSYAVLGSYVDKILVASAQVAVRIANIISENLGIFLP
jgi:hypothetical protein